jgi:septal ring factor EnvC (AmiA/AmiB activator)
MSPALDERARIRAAMNRVLTGTAQRSTGALTIVALAQEADVPRNALTQRHTDLKTEFYEHVKQRGGTPDVETRLRTEIAKLKKTITNKNKELKQLRADVPALVRTINVLTLETSNSARPTNRTSRSSYRSGPDAQPTTDKCLPISEGWAGAHRCGSCCGLPGGRGLRQ